MIIHQVADVPIIGLDIETDVLFMSDLNLNLRKKHSMRPKKKCSRIKIQISTASGALELFFISTAVYSGTLEFMLFLPLVALANVLFPPPVDGALETCASLDSRT